MVLNSLLCIDLSDRTNGSHAMLAFDAPFPAEAVEALFRLASTGSLTANLPFCLLPVILFRFIGFA